MEIEQVAELARAVAGLPQDQRDYFEGMVADERAAAAEAERIARLRTMSDLDAVQFAMKQASDVFALGELPERLLAALRDAGFVREEPKQKIEFIFPGGHHIKLYGSREALGCVREHLCAAIPGLKYSKGA